MTRPLCQAPLEVGTRSASPEQGRAWLFSLRRLRKITPYTKNPCLVHPYRREWCSLLSLKCFRTTKATFNTGLGLQLFQSHLLHFSSSAELCRSRRRKLTTGYEQSQEDDIWKPAQSVSFYPLALTYASVLRHTNTKRIPYMACWPSVPNFKFQRLEQSSEQDTCKVPFTAVISVGILVLPFLIQHAEAKLHRSLMDTPHFWEPVRTQHHPSKGGGICDRGTVCGHS